MLGKQHLTLSVTTAAVLTAPFIQTHTETTLLILAGTAIGSLIPDIDAPDAKIFHKDILNTKHKSVNHTIGLIPPIFGYTTKYLIYKPVIRLFNLVSRKHVFQHKHRTFTHSLLGITTITAVTGIYLYLILNQLNLLNHQHLLTFLTGYLLGTLLHLLQDSCTKTGIQWNQPFTKTTLKGKLKTGKSIWKPRLLLIILVLLIPVNLYINHIKSLTTIYTLFYSIIMVKITWLTFTKLIAQTTITR